MKMFVIGILMLSFSSYAAAEILKFNVTITHTLAQAQNEAESQFQSFLAAKQCKAIGPIKTNDIETPLLIRKRSFTGVCEYVKKVGDGGGGAGLGCPQIYEAMKREGVLFGQRLAAKNFVEANWAITAYQQLIIKWKANNCK